MLLFFLFQANSEIKANFLSNYISLEQTRKNCKNCEKRKNCVTMTKLSIVFDAASFKKVAMLNNHSLATIKELCMIALH